MAATLFAGAMAALFAASILLDVAAAASYTVGGSSGWTIPPNTPFYSDWSNAQKLVPGDTLVFNFPTGIHNVVKVPKASYDSCSAQNQIGSTLSSGPATVTLATGTHYYICGVAGHCSAGQKLAITVAAAAAAPVPSPAAATTPVSVLLEISSKLKTLRPESRMTLTVPAITQPLKAGNRKLKPLLQEFGKQFESGFRKGIQSEFRKQIQSEFAPPTPAEATTPGSPSPPFAPPTPAEATTPDSPSPPFAPAATAPAQPPTIISPSAMSPETAPSSQATP